MLPGEDQVGTGKGELVTFFWREDEEALTERALGISSSCSPACAAAGGSGMNAGF